MNESEENAGRVAFDASSVRRVSTAASPLLLRPVHRSLVHKKNADQVVLREARSDDGQRLEFNIRGARRQLRSTLDDASFVAESLRQSTIALAHLLHDAAYGWAFLMDRMIFRLHTASLIDQLPTAIRMTARDVRRRGAHLHSLTSEMEMVSGEKTIARGEGYLRVVSPLVYQRLRDRRPMRHSSPATKRNAHPITLSRNAGDAGVLSDRWVASIDDNDPFYFDHDVDHVPGMAIFEAACALATTSSPFACPHVDFFDGRFHQFVEFEALLELSIERPPMKTEDRYCVRVDATTDGRVSMSACIGVSAP